MKIARLAKTSLFSALCLFSNSAMAQVFDSPAVYVKQGIIRVEWIIAIIVALVLIFKVLKTHLIKPKDKSITNKK